MSGKLIKNKDDFINQYRQKFQEIHGKPLNEGTAYDYYAALAGLVRDLISLNWVKTNRNYHENQAKQVYYFSIEFLPGKLLDSYLSNMGIKDLALAALHELGIDFAEITTKEPDAGLGNGGLGRLASCFMDSMASCSLAGHGCGIRYKYGFFEQKIVDGFQVELPNNWLKNGNVWEIRKSDKAVEVRFGGDVRTYNHGGKTSFIHKNYEPVKAVPYDIPLVGYMNGVVNTLRLWSAEVASERDFDLSCFNRGDYLKAVAYKNTVESISQILYPDDSNRVGRELRLKQQYFLVSAGVQSIVRHFKKKNGSLENFAEKIVIHINDTHPVLVIPELIRILIDEEGMDWNDAWQIISQTISYTNHTILPESLEEWSVSLFRSLLPRIYMIVEEINKRFCGELWNKYPGDWKRISDMAIIADDHIRMTNLAAASSFSVNGVAHIHTEILKSTILKNFNDYFPHKINNKTNGISHRRWCLEANPDLSQLIIDNAGSNCIKHPMDITCLLKLTDDQSFLEKLSLVKRKNKEKVAKMIRDKYDLIIDVDSIFDIHMKRIHMYKRQLLNIFHILDLYRRLKEKPDLDIYPRTFIFSGKAAPSYQLAKDIIKLINDMSYMINNDKSIKDKIKIIFLENYNVSLAEQIIPAADVSEQISTASKEASGTGNMKFMMNGALTIGTLDGANIEIKDKVGTENMFVFGMTADEVLNYYQNGGYDSWTFYNQDSRIKWILNQLVAGTLNDDREQYKRIHDSLLYDNDEFFVLKDFSSYVNAQTRLDQAYRDQNKWLRMSVANIANSGIFSSDRTILEYAVGIWDIEQLIK